jgi:anti-sigma factor RsiW
MNLKRILELIEDDRSASERSEPVPIEGKECLNEIEIAAYYEKNIPAPRRAQIEKHLADCHRCVELLIMFSKIASAPIDTEPMPDADARKLTDTIIRLIHDDDSQH